MMRERKDRPVNRAVNCRSIRLALRTGSCLERRQYPHAAPAVGGALEKDFIFSDDKGVVLSEPFCARTSFL